MAKADGRRIELEKIRMRILADGPEEQSVLEPEIILATPEEWEFATRCDPSLASWPHATSPRHGLVVALVPSDVDCWRRFHPVRDIDAMR